MDKETAEAGMKSIRICIFCGTALGHKNMSRFVFMKHLKKAHGVNRIQSTLIYDALKNAKVLERWVQKHE